MNHVPLFLPKDFLHTATIGLVGGIKEFCNCVLIVILNMAPDLTNTHVELFSYCVENSSHKLIARWKQKEREMEARGEGPGLWVGDLESILRLICPHSLF